MSKLPRRCVIIMAIAACGAVYVDAARPQDPQPPPGAPPAQAAASPRAVVDRYCVTCHNARLKRGDLVLEGLDVEHVGSNAATWEKVVKKLQAGVMPPAGSPRPAADVYHGFLTTLLALSGFCGLRLLRFVKALGFFVLIGLFGLFGLWGLTGLLARGRAAARPGRRRLVRVAAGLFQKLRRIPDPGSLGADRGGCGLPL